MHEGAIAQALLEQVLNFMPEGSKLHHVHIEVGQMEHLDESVLATYWQALTADTPQEGSRLKYTLISLKVRCRECATEYEPDEPALMICPNCGAARPEVLQGSGVVLKSLEVEEA